MEDSLPFIRQECIPAYKSVCMMGVWDWTDLGNELAEEEELPVWYKRFAPVPESELATVLSPSTYVDRIKMPIFIVYSGKDEVVYPSQNIRAILELSATAILLKAFIFEEGHFPESIQSQDDNKSLESF